MGLDLYLRLQVHLLQKQIAKFHFQSQNCTEMGLVQFSEKPKCFPIQMDSGEKVETAQIYHLSYIFEHIGIIWEHKDQSW